MVVVPPDRVGACRPEDEGGDDGLVVEEGSRVQSYSCCPPPKLNPPDEPFALAVVVW